MGWEIVLQLSHRGDEHWHEAFSSTTKQCYQKVSYILGFDEKPWMVVSGRNLQFEVLKVLKTWQQASYFCFNTGSSIAFSMSTRQDSSWGLGLQPFLELPR